MKKLAKTTYLKLIPVFQAGGDEERKQEIQAIICKMESLMKELEGLLKRDGNALLSFIMFCIGAW